MDKFITLGEAASELSAKSSLKLLYFAIEQDIKLYWLQGDIQGLTITPLSVADAISDLTGESIKTYRPDKFKLPLKHHHGPWLLDPQVDERWPHIFKVLKDTSSLDLVLQPLDPPLRFTLDGEVFASYTPNPHEFNTPKLSELYIDSSELGKIKKLLKGEHDTPIIRDLGKQRLNAIESYIRNDSTSYENPSRGKRGYKDVVWQALKNLRTNNNNSLLFAKKGANTPDKSIFSTAWKKRSTKGN